ncbi:VPLPA-CTERM sorting domain-containing protein [Fluviibacterium sp. DFM31]|uniref:VPLPA-CTERM sorting domain-containing protein n=1 Tax=Meridianimarinicoccus marinus TaxID=3231483 RepID=A0ABV3L1Q2_9RHOB
MFKFFCAASVAALSATSALAVSVSPTSYSMPNGNTGSYWYFDDSYNGSGSTTTVNAPLSGGTGDLTDGVIATQNWTVVEPPAGSPTGPYVGWSIDPTITFFFNQLTNFNSATFHFDDSGGAGGVSPPRAVTRTGGATVAVTDPPGDVLPFAFDYDLTGVSASQLTFTIARSNAWVFLSEVTFDAVPTSDVPLPAGLGLIASALAGLGLLRYRRRTA